MPRSLSPGILCWPGLGKQRAPPWPQIAPAFAARPPSMAVALSGRRSSCENPRPRAKVEPHVTATLLDGKAVAQQIRDELVGRVTNVAQRLGRPPALAIVLVGDDPASEVYVRNKLKTAEDAGMGVHLERLPGATSLAALLAVVDRFNKDPKYDGILVQSPLPKALGADAEQRVFDAIDPGKDVDGFSPISAGPRHPEPRRVCALHPRRRDRAPGAHQDPNRRQACRRHRPFRHRRQTDGGVAAPQERHRDDLPFAHARPAGDGAHRRHPRRRDRTAGVRDAQISSNRAPSSSTSASTP